MEMVTPREQNTQASMKDSTRRKPTSLVYPRDKKHGNRRHRCSEKDDTKREQEGLMHLRNKKPSGRQLKKNESQLL